MVATGVLVAACSGAAAPTTGPQSTSAPTAPDKVSLQLKWVTQAQFAGYYAALDKGFYKAENLDVTILEGGPNIASEQVVASGGAGKLEHMAEVLLAGKADAVLAASIFHFGTYTVGDVKQYLAQQKIPVRL